MTISAPTNPAVVTMADLLDRLGGVSPARVRFNPYPGTATEEDVVQIEQRENRLYELVDGALVEKVTGYRESMMAVAIAAALDHFVTQHNLGVVTGADGMMRLFPGLVRIPDVAFVSSGRLPGGHVPTDPIPGIVPDLAVEVLSPSNTPPEMDRKRREYFDAGVRLLWLVNLDARQVTVYTGVENASVVPREGALDGGPVLPNFRLPLAPLFARLDR